MRNYIISGGPCSGKTSIIEALRKQNFICFDEIARQVISEEQDKNSHYLPWINNLAFSELVLTRMLDDIKTSKTYQTCFFDRGIPDLVGYMQYYKNEIPQYFIEHMKNASYHHQVFFLEPWYEIYETDQERTETFEESIKISHSLKTTYKQYGFEIIILKKTSVKHRIELIKKHSYQHPS